MKELFASRGFCHLPGLIDPKVAAGLEGHLNQLFDRMSGRKRGSLSLKDMLIEDHEAIQAQRADSAAGLTMKIAGLCRDFVASLLDREITILIQPSICRRQEVPSPDLHLPYHQDGLVVGHAGRSVTAWVALTDGAGRTSPGLAVVPLPVGRLLRTAGGFRDGIAGPDLDPLLAAGGEYVAECGPGDVLLFQDDIIHRTFTHPEMTRPRLSVEFRLLLKGSEPWKELTGQQAAASMM